MKGSLTLATIAAAACTMLTAAPAQADTGDAAFVSYLQQKGLPVSGPAILAGNQARQVCGGLNYGWTNDIAVYAVKTNYPSFTDAQANTFIQASIATYCPS